jgi:23S rRNA maturation-related 3'-5' exoribonuclease YhaM
MTFYGYNEETINSVISEIEMSMADIMEEIDDIEEEAESSKILKDMLRNEIESSSSSEER